MSKNRGQEKGPGTRWYKCPFSRRRLLTATPSSSPRRVLLQAGSRTSWGAGASSDMETFGFAGLALGNYAIGSKLLGDSLITCEFHPSTSRICLSQNLPNPWLRLGTLKLIPTLHRSKHKGKDEHHQTLFGHQFVTFR